MTPPPQPVTACRGYGMPLSAGASRLQRLAPWANASTRAGNGFAAVSRPLRVTRAGAQTPLGGDR